MLSLPAWPSMPESLPAPVTRMSSSAPPVSRVTRVVNGVVDSANSPETSSPMNSSPVRKEILSFSSPPSASNVGAVVGHIPLP